MPPLETTIQRYYPLGNKTLLMLIIHRSAFVFVLLIVLIVGLFGLQYVPAEYIDLALYIFIGYLMMLVVFSLIGVFLGWLEYSRYEIVLGDKNLKMQRGLISVEQVGIPYRYIQDIKVERSLLDQIIGVSELMVTTAGIEQQEIHPGKGAGGNIHRIILPAIENRIARQIQEIVLNRAQIQQIDISNRGL